MDGKPVTTDLWSSWRRWAMSEEQPIQSQTTADIVARLRATQDDWPAALVKLECEAADEIERLRGIIRELRAVHVSMGDLFISTRDEIR